MHQIMHHDYAIYLEAAGIKTQTELNGVTLTVCKDGATFVEDQLGNVYQV